eukprot:4946209-Pyramimonas_sp.AAC.1
MANPERTTRGDHGCGHDGLGHGHHKGGGPANVEEGLRPGRHISRTVDVLQRSLVRGLIASEEAKERLM